MDRPPDRIADRHPGLKLVIDHVGLNVRGKGPKVWDDLPAVCALAKHANVAVKATAGLHHAIRGEYRLTYVPESDVGTMHGFVNLVLAATLLMTGKIDEELADACLDDDRPEAFKISGRAGSWLNGVVTYSEVAHARSVLLRSIGTCSFEEPVAEIDALDFGLRGVDRVP